MGTADPARTPLPPGILRDLAAFIPDCVTTVRRLRKDPRVPRRAKVAVLIAGLWVASPVDLIPEFLPVIGPLDEDRRGRTRPALCGSTGPPAKS
ncbi:YkvA family protein [Salinispora arenicola]|uniref:YkvA family protein n=1 Tax=Salinispora arenicola TaxID=168697 RepID=UPI003137E6C2